MIKGQGISCASHAQGKENAIFFRQSADPMILDVAADIRLLTPTNAAGSGLMLPLTALKFSCQENAKGS
jgi:hypothetical protein